MGPALVLYEDIQISYDTIRGPSWFDGETFWFRRTCLVHLSTSACQIEDRLTTSTVRVVRSRTVARPM